MPINPYTTMLPRRRCRGFRNPTKDCQLEAICDNCGNPHADGECRAAPHCVNFSHHNSKQITAFASNHNTSASTCTSYKPYDTARSQRFDCPFLPLRSHSATSLPLILQVPGIIPLPLCTSTLGPSSFSISNLFRYYRYFFATVATVSLVSILILTEASRTSSEVLPSSLLYPPSINFIFVTQHELYFQNLLLFSLQQKVSNHVRDEPLSILVSL